MEKYVTKEEFERFYKYVIRQLKNMRLGTGLGSHQHVKADITDFTHASDHEVGGSDQIDHDNLLNFVASEHIDWSVTGIETIHLDRIPATLTGKDADSVDGYHLNQGVQTTDSPTFQDVISSLGYSLIPTWYVLKLRNYISVTTSNSDSWTIVNSGTASVSVNWQIIMNTGTTIDSTARIYSGVFIKRFFSTYSNEYLFIQGDSGANGLNDSIVYFGVTDSTSEITDTTKMIGWKVTGGIIYAHVADGTNVTNVSTGVTWTTAYAIKYFIIIKDTNSIKFYINGTLKATITTNIPTNLYNGRLVFQINNITATARYLRIFKIGVID